MSANLSLGLILSLSKDEADAKHWPKALPA